jgi:hypothetical protein
MFQVFVGVLTLGSASTYAAINKAAGDFSAALDLVRQISGWILVAVGFIYILMVRAY